jgi:hypothetical protein
MKAKQLRQHCCSSTAPLQVYTGGAGPCQICLMLQATPSRPGAAAETVRQAALAATLRHWQLQCRAQRAVLPLHPSDTRQWSTMADRLLSKTCAEYRPKRVLSTGPSKRVRSTGSQGRCGPTRSALTRPMEIETRSFQMQNKSLCCHSVML